MQVKELDALTSLPHSENYTQKERYSDFRKTFSTPEGQRTLREILSWCHLLKPSVYGSPIDSNLVLLKEGERNIGLRLLTTYHNEPPERPDRARKDNVSKR